MNGFFKTRPLLAADLALLTVAAVWGTTFVIVKMALAEVSVEAFLLLRFLLAFTFLAGFRAVRPGAPEGRTVLAGGILGFFLFLSYFFQTEGLAYTTATNAGFITGFNVILVPILSILFLRKPPSLGAFMGAGIATLGLLLLAGFSLPHWNRGDLLVLVCAFTVAGHTLLTGHFSPHHGVVDLTMVQMGTIALLSGFLTGARGTFPEAVSPLVWASLLVCALFASVAAFLIQTAGQRVVSPTRTAILFTMEPVFAGITGWVFLGERLTGQALLGAALIVGGMLLSEISPERWSEALPRLWEKRP